MSLNRLGAALVVVICLLLVAYGGCAAWRTSSASVELPTLRDLGPTPSPVEALAMSSTRPIAYITLDGQNYGTVCRVLVPGGALYLWAVGGKQPTMVYAPYIPAK